MKTAVSIPDVVFQRAESAARRMRISRGELYAKAIAAYIERGSEEEVTRALNAVYATESATLDPAIAAMQSRSIPKERW